MTHDREVHAIEPIRRDEAMGDRPLPVDLEVVRHDCRPLKLAVAIKEVCGVPGHGSDDRVGDRNAGGAKIMHTIEFIHATMNTSDWSKALRNRTD